MMIFRAWLFFLVCPLVALANDAKIKGTAPSLAGHEIRLIKFSDPISGGQVVLDLDTIDEGGNFQLSFAVEEIEEVYLTINRFRAPLFLSPGSTYSIFLPDQPEFDLLPTWRPSGFEYIFENPDSSDINFRIAEFDEAYFSFYRDNARLIGTSAIKSAIREFAAEMDSSDGFIETYKSYSLAEMKLSAGFPKNDLYTTYLKNENLHWQNPAFRNFFEKFYGDYFDQYDVRFGGESLVNRFRKGLTYQELDSLLLKDDFLQREEIRQWVILKSINENLYGKKYSATSLLSFLDELQKRAANSELELAAANVRERYQSTIKNLALTELPLIHLPDSTGKPSFLAIGHLESKEFIKELSLVESMEEEYGNYFAVIPVFLSSEAERAVPENLTTTTNEFELMNRLGIYSLPWYGWVNRKGEIMERELQKPSTGLEERLYRIRAKKIQEDKIRIGQ